MGELEGLAFISFGDWIEEVRNTDVMYKFYAWKNIGEGSFSIPN